MAFPKLKCCWNGSGVEAEWFFGLFGIYTRGLAGGRLRGIVISGRGLLAWLSVLTVVAYFTGAAALGFWLGRRPYNNITYADLILPTRWSGLQKLRGQALVAEGMDNIKARQWGAGLAKLRTGIARNPDEIQGRLVLAELLTAMKARRQAIAIYDGGLTARYPGRDYIETMIKSAEQSENFEWWLRTCDRALVLVAGHPDLATDRKWLIQQKLAALLAAERADEALALAEAEGETGNPAIGEFRVLALLKAGKPAEALSFLGQWADRIGPRADPQVLSLQVRAFREIGDTAGMDRSLAELRSQSPTDPRAYVYGIVQYLLAGRRSEADAEFGSFLLRFGGTPRYLQMLAVPLADVSERPMLEQLVGYARQQGFELEPFQRLLVQSLVGRGEWQAASAALAEIADAPKKNAPASPWHEVMHAQIQAALDPADGAQSNLVDFVRGRQLTVSVYKDLVVHMRSAGRPETAREIVTYAQGVYPQNASFETWRKELDDELAAVRAAKPVVVPIRPATAEAAVSPPPRVQLAEADFMARLDALTRAGDYPGALNYLRDVRMAKPDWLTGREEELYRYEVRFSGRVGDMLALRSAVRLYNNGNRLRSIRMIEIARELNAAGCKEAAVFLLKELLTKVPDHPAALKQLAEWTPEAPPTTPRGMVPPAK